MDTPDVICTVPGVIPPYDGSDTPTYGKVNVSCDWPYRLELVGPGATWKKIDLEKVGERWLVVDLSYTDAEGRNADANLRNNRYEAMIAARTLRPQFIAGLLADRHTAVASDLSSIEYLARKLADSVECMWDRSGTGDNGDVPMRVWFDSYQIGFPKDDAEWVDLNKKYEGNRGLGGWFGGPHERYERFDWEDGGNELHETGHLFCPLDDLYGYGVSPEMTLFDRMADGRPVQLLNLRLVPGQLRHGPFHHQRRGHGSRQGVVRDPREGASRGLEQLHLQAGVGPRARQGRQARARRRCPRDVDLRAENAVRVRQDRTGRTLGGDAAVRPPAGRLLRPHVRGQDEERRLHGRHGADLSPSASAATRPATSGGPTTPTRIRELPRCTTPSPIRRSGPGTSKPTTNPAPRTRRSRPGPACRAARSPSG